MNLARHAAVLWRFRYLTATGLLAGLALAVLAGWQVNPSGSPKLKPKGTETWQATSSILVTQPGFPEGRVTLPTTQIGDAKTAAGETVNGANAAPKDQVEFADPNRLAALGDLYSKLLVSDEVRTSTPGRPLPKQIAASPFSASEGGQILPVIQLNTQAPTEKGAHDLNINTFNAFSALLQRQQRQNHIPVGHRVEVRMIDTPDGAMLVSGRKHLGSIVVLLLALLGTLALTHLLEALRPQRPDPVALAEIEGIEEDEPEDESSEADVNPIPGIRFAPRRQGG